MPSSATRKRRNINALNLVGKITLPSRSGENSLSPRGILGSFPPRTIKVVAQTAAKPAPQRGAPGGGDYLWEPRLEQRWEPENEILWAVRTTAPTRPP